MWNNLVLKRLSLVTVFLFCWFCFTPNYMFSQQNGDELEEARRLFQQGYYDDAITLLNEYIEKIKTVAEQKKNVARAFYQLAKVYFTVGEDDKVDESLKKVFETYPDFQTEETDLVFHERVETFKRDAGFEAKVDRENEKAEGKVMEDAKSIDEEDVMQEEPQPEKKVISQPVEKKKKRFPWLLVIGGVVVAGVLAYFLLFKKKEESKITDVNVRIDMKFTASNLGCRHIIRVNGIEQFNEFLAFNVPGYDDYDLAKKINRTITVTVPPGSFTIQHEIHPDYIDYYPAQETWIWSTGFVLSVLNYNYQGDNPGSPIISETSFFTTVAPWVNDLADEWYRIENKTISMIVPSPSSLSGKYQRSTKSVNEVRYLKTKKPS